MNVDVENIKKLKKKSNTYQPDQKIYHMKNILNENAKMILQKNSQ